MDLSPFLSLPLFAFRDLVAHKIPERFPQLRIGFIEASASWVPYVLHHLARSSGAKLNAGGDADAAMEWGPKLFSDYRLYVAAEADEDLAYLLTHIGEDNMTMGSDYGHQDQSKEDGMVGVMRRKKSISPAVIEKILCDNPRRFYGLCNYVIEDAETKTFLCLEHPMQVAASVARSARSGSFRRCSPQRLEQSAAVERLERFERPSLLYGARHRCSLEAAFPPEKLALSS